MIKYLALTVMLASPISAAALTADQELSQKCELRMSGRAKNVKGKTLFQDKRICACMVEEIKKKTPANKMQDVADFYTEKYENVAAKDPSKELSVPHIGGQCLTKYYSRDQINAEAKKIVEANKAYAAAKKLEQDKVMAENKRKLAAMQAQKPAKETQSKATVPAIKPEAAKKTN